MNNAWRRFSADSHLEISPDLWVNRVESQYRDKAPRRITIPEGGDAVLFEGAAPSVVGLGLAAKPIEKYESWGVTFEGELGAGGPDQRIKEQDDDGIAGEVIFAGAGYTDRMAALSDREAYSAIVHAYNSFLAEDYCSADRTRLVAMGVVPESGIDAAIKELEHCAASGLKGVELSKFPSGKGYPTLDDDRFWERALDLGMPIAVHTCFRSGPGPSLDYVKRPAALDESSAGWFGFGSDPVLTLLRHGENPYIKNPLQLILAGVFDRFPNLKIYFAETNIGWLPSTYEQVDNSYRLNCRWLARDFTLPILRDMPSVYLKRHCAWGFLRDVYGVKHRDECGIDNIMWGSDFPHGAGHWPSSPVLEEMFADIPEMDRNQIAAGNVQEWFRL